MQLPSQKSMSGLILCLIIAIPAWFLGKSLPLIGGPVFGILLGMVGTAGALKLTETTQTGFFSRYTPGFQYTSKTILQVSIVFLGFEMNLLTVLQVGMQSLAVIIGTLTAAFLTAFIIGKWLKLDSKIVTLIGVGTSICGGSAIAATAPVINAKDEDVSQSISTIFLFNIVAVFIFPAIGRWLGLTDSGFGMWAGTAVNDTSSVVAAATAWSSLAGNNTALAFATVVKLTRTLMIIPICLTLSLYWARKGEQPSFSAAKAFPWFVLGFMGAAALRTTGFIPTAIILALVSTGKFMIVMAMTAIGFNTHLSKLLKNGKTAALLGLCCWFAVATVSLVIQKAMHLW